MKVFIVAILLLVSSSFALKMKTEHQKHNHIIALQIDRGSSLGAAIKELIQLAEVNEYADVIDILQKIRDEFSVITQRTTENLDSEKQAFEEHQRLIQESIAELQNKIEQTDQSLTNNRQERATLEAAINANSAAIAQARADYDTEVSRRATADANYKKQNENAAAALAALTEAEDILKKIQQADLGKVGVSFLETQRKKLTRHLSLIQEKVSKMQLKTVPLGFYIKELVQISQDVGAQGTVNADLFTRIFALIGNFRTALEAEGRAAVQANQEDAERSARVLAICTDNVNTQQAQLERNQERLAEIRAIIQREEDALASLKNSLEDTVTNLAELRKNWVVKAQTLQGYIARLQADINVLENALTYIRSQNYPTAEAGAGVGVSAAAI